ncbi:hypothetical protein SAMN04488540_101396 [Ferrimonas sediminum]|uniref:Uncharacterized protein n=1 Tax=Ferrimonas sediminum TaxID=718193 RepID=A0A1G8KJF1_9GAMM|nr:hypothetical protein [Ferrimonas sediminum]SDI43577.1 hypothetical protein SAMN04488540_101396 [Ferrimonas sediminum]
MQVGSQASLQAYQSLTPKTARPQPHADEAGAAKLNATEAPSATTTPAPADKNSNMDEVTSFTYGALGMDHPDVIEEIDDPTYTAGQYAKAALSIGGLLLALA